MDNIKHNTSYKRAKKRIEKIKGFYIHLIIFILFNIFMGIQNFIDHGVEGLLYSFMGFGLFWGIGLFFHWYGVFGKGLFFKDWENQKIKELMEDEEKEMWK
jgi:hypothetical protein